MKDDLFEHQPRRVTRWKHIHDDKEKQELARSRQSCDEMVATLLKYIGHIISTDNPRDKGWRGKAVEKLAGLPRSNHQASDEYSHELKTVLSKENKSGTHREAKDGRIAITQTNKETLLKEKRFQDSGCWRKLQQLIIVFVEDLDTGPWQSRSIIRGVRPVKFQNDKKIFEAFEADYDYLRGHVKRFGFDSLSRRLLTPNGLLHIGTKGPKGTKGTKPRAFYLTNKAFEIRGY